MKNLVILIIFLCASCKSLDVNNNSASETVLDMINHTNKELKKYKKGRKANFKYSIKLVNLSDLKPKYTNKNFISNTYIPNEKDLEYLLEWYEKNKHLLSYYNNSDVEKFYLDKNEKIIKIEYETNKFRFSVSEYELNQIIETTEKIKNLNE